MIKDSGPGAMGSVFMPLALLWDPQQVISLLNGASGSN